MRNYTTLDEAAVLLKLLLQPNHPGSWLLEAKQAHGPLETSHTLLSLQAILMDSNCSMKTRSYSTQDTLHQRDSLDQDAEGFD